MNKSFFILALTMLMAVTMLTSCQSKVKRVENAKDKVIEAKQELDQALEDSIQQFRKASEDKISKYEKNIADFRLKIANEKMENKSIYDKKLAELVKKNSDLKKKLADYKYDERTKWKIFKAEYNHDMDQLGKSFKDLTVKNVK